MDEGGDTASATAPEGVQLPCEGGINAVGEGAQPRVHSEGSDILVEWERTIENQADSCSQSGTTVSTWQHE